VSNSLKLVIAALLFLPVTSLAASPDRHEKNDPASALYQQSVFAHGYIHGYEEGFHLADGDYQMGRAARELEQVQEFKDADGGYHREFGNKYDFKMGYREGFRAGYGDSFHNRPFRAVNAASLAAEGLQPNERPNVNFESGFVDGYRAAAEGTPQSCVSQKDRAPEQLNLEYCDGFGRGFQFAVQASTELAQRSEQQNVQTASARTRK
jgi:hypothetical protein